MISMKFDCHKKRLLEQEYFTGSMPLLTPNHSFAVLRILPVLQLLRNVVEKLAQEGWNA